MLGSLLFIIYVNDLCNVSRIFETLIFSNDANLFFSQKNMKGHFHIVNLELSKIFQKFNANKLSLNKNETTYTLFHKVQEKDTTRVLDVNIFSFLHSYLSYGNTIWSSATTTKLKTQEVN